MTYSSIDALKLLINSLRVDLETLILQCSLRPTHFLGDAKGPLTNSPMIDLGSLTFPIQSRVWLINPGRPMPFFIFFLIDFFSTLD
jgi:hypothetical protein